MARHALIDDPTADLDVDADVVVGVDLDVNVLRGPGHHGIVVVAYSDRP